MPTGLEGVRIHDAWLPRALGELLADEPHHHVVAAAGTVGVTKRIGLPGSLCAGCAFATEAAPPSAAAPTAMACLRLI
jgi:hypothetical protein